MLSHHHHHGLGPWILPIESPLIISEIEFQKEACLPAAPTLFCFSFLLLLYTTLMSFELDTVSYGLLASIFGATAFLSLRNYKGPDIHPLLLNTQADVSRLRHAGESAIYRSRMYPNGSPLLSIFDRGVRTLLDLHEQGGQSKHSQASFLGQHEQWVSKGMSNSEPWLTLSFDSNLTVGLSMGRL